MGDDVETLLLETSSKQHKLSVDAKTDYCNADWSPRVLASQITEIAGCQPDICFDTTGVEFLQQATVFVSSIFMQSH